MKNASLPAGHLTLIKSATRDLIAACAAPGLTGLQAASAITGVPVPTLSRYQLPHYPDVMPLHVVLSLEQASGAPAVTRAMASLTGHQVVAIEAEASPAAELSVRLMGIVTAQGHLVAEAGEALSDGRVTPAEARAVIRQGHRTIRETAELVDRMAAIAEGEG